MIVRAKLTTAFVWGVWALMFVEAIHFVASYSDGMPYWDDWTWVPYVTHAEPLTLSWLWSLQNEHRVMLPRLVYLGSVWASGDLRTPMFVEVVALAAVSLGLLLTVKRLRGRWTFADAFFPLVLLNWGNAGNLLWGFGLQFIGSGVLACVALITVATWEAKWWRILLLGASFVGLVLCGINGLVVVVPLAAWLVRLGVAEKNPTLRWSMLAVALLAAVLAGFYFVGYHGNPAHPKPHGLGPIVGTTAELFAIGLGPAGRDGWPYSGPIVILVVITALAVLLTRLRNSSERIRTEGVLACLVGLLIVASAIGWGRSGFGPGVALADRYVMLSSPLLCVAYLAWVRPGSLSAAMQMGLFTMACAAAAYNVGPGERFGMTRHAQALALEDELALGVPLSQLAERHTWLYPDASFLSNGLKLLRDAHIKPFDAPMVTDEPAHEASTVKLDPERIPTGMMDPRPNEVTSGVGVDVLRVYDREVLQVHAPGVVRFHLSAGVYCLTAAFGLRPEAYQQGWTTGVAFSVTSAEVPLFTRHLDPIRVDADRGIQALALEFEFKDAGDLVLRTSSANTVRWAWSFWSGVRIKRSHALNTQDVAQTGGKVLLGP